MNYSAIELAVLIVLLAGVTLLARNLFLVLPRRWQPRGALERALRYAPLAALVAITLPEVLRSSVLLPGAAPLALLTDARMWSAVVLALVLRRTRNGLAAMAAGSAVYFLLLALHART